MKKNINLLSLFILVIVSSFAYSQNGSILGNVKDNNGEPLPFVKVVALNQMNQESAVGTVSNMMGDFNLSLPPGKYIVYGSYMGYTCDSSVIEIASNQNYEKNIIMYEIINEMDIVEVITERKTNTENAVIQEVKNSQSVVNAISSEMIEKTGDSDASEVVRRVPGVTIIGNNFIMIRGLSERYNNVMLHDVFAPSMETDVKSFAFDIIPSSMIDRVLIYKSPAPELTGEFAGGVVKIYTKSIPVKNFTSIGFSTTYRNGSSFQNFSQSERSNLHWTGFNDGYNSLPSNFPGNINSFSNDPDRMNDVGRSLKNNWVPQQVNSMMDKSFSFAHGRKMKWGKVTVGNITAVTYSNSRTIFESERNDYNAYDFTNDKSSFIYSFNDKQFTHNIRTGFLHNWAFRLNSNHMIELKNMYNVSSQTEYVNRTGYDYEFNYSPNNASFNQVYRGIYSGQVVGTHQFNEEKTKLNWTLGYGYSYRDQPDYKRYRTEIDTNDNSSKLFVGIPLSPNYLGRFYSDLRENNQSANVALSHIYDFNGWKPLIKTGIFFERKYRSFVARNIGYVQSNFIGFDQNLLEGTIEELFMPENINSSTGIKIGESTNPSDSYTASNLLNCGYVGGELPFLNKRMILNTGVRVEYNIQQLNSRTLTNIPIIVDNPILSVLPSANLSYYLKEDKLLLRVAYGKSVNRPEFRELAPFGFYDFNFNLVKKGSDSLRTPTIHNFDLRLENYPNPGEMITVALFYKQFIDPIETLFVPGGGSGGIKTFTYGNARTATSMGIELEIRKSLQGLTKLKFVDDLSILLNGSLIKSQVNLGLEQLGQSNQRPLQGQSPYILNAGLFYQNKKLDLQANVLYNIIGPRIFIIGFDVYPDIYQMPRGILDFNVSKKFKNNMELKLQIGDVLNQDFVLLQDANKNGKFEKNNDQIIQRYNLGTTYQIGFGYKF